MRQNRLINFSQPGVKKGNFMNEEKELKKNQSEKSSRRQSTSKLDYQARG